MEDPKNTSLFTLPPGCRFHPSEEQLFCYYLTNKNATRTISNCDDEHDGDDYAFGFNVIKEVDLYSCDPFDLPEIACFSYGYRGRKRHWYCYTAAEVKEGAMRRKAGGGYWKRKGRVRDVVGMGRGRVVLGTRTSFVYYLGNSPKNAVRTDWVMSEYALVDHLKAFVLCRIFVKSRCGNSLSDHVLSSCAEGSVSTVRHVGGIQHDEIVTSDVAGAKVCDDHSVDRENGILGFPMRVVKDIDDRLTAGSVSVTRFQIPTDIHPSELVRSPGIHCDDALFIDPICSHAASCSIDLRRPMDWMMVNPKRNQLLSAASPGLIILC